MSSASPSPLTANKEATMLPSDLLSPLSAPAPLPDPPPQPTLDAQAISAKADEVIARLMAQAAPRPSAAELDISKRADDVIARLEAESRARGPPPGRPTFHPRPPVPPPGFRPPPPAHYAAHPPFPPPPHSFYPPPLPPPGMLRPLFPPFPPFPPPVSAPLPPPSFPSYNAMTPTTYRPPQESWRPPPIPPATPGAPIRLGFPAPPVGATSPPIGQTPPLATRIPQSPPRAPMPPVDSLPPRPDRSTSLPQIPVVAASSGARPAASTSASSLAANPKLQEVLAALSTGPVEESTVSHDPAASPATEKKVVTGEPSAEDPHPARDSGTTPPSVGPASATLDLKSPADQPNLRRQIFLGSLSPTTTLEMLRKAFSPLSPIVTIELRTPLAMIEFEEDGAAAMAVDIYDKAKLGGALLRVERAAQSPTDRKRPLDESDESIGNDETRKRSR